MLKVVMANSALRLKAILDFEDESGEKRVAGDEWLFEGPGIKSLILIYKECSGIIISDIQKIKITLRYDVVAVCLNRMAELMNLGHIHVTLISFEVFPEANCGFEGHFCCI